MSIISINRIYQKPALNAQIVVCGWVRAYRSNRFVALSDGSSLKTLQCVIDFESFDEKLLRQITIGAAIMVKGELVESQGRGQSIEVQVQEIEILGVSDAEKYPIQRKKHGMEFLRTQAHLRARTNTLAAVMRVRSAVAFAIHNYFRKNDFYYIHTPIITGSDAEGAGEMFRVTTLPDKNPPLNGTGNVDYSADFFGKETNLTVSGQLEAEAYAMALSKVYTFGPTFRAENSNTSRHLAEFWMVEPEVAFMDIHGLMDLAENFLKGVLKEVLERCSEDMEFLSDRLTKEESQKAKHLRSEFSLIEKIQFVLDNNFTRLSYTEAIEILKESKPNKKGKFEYTVEGWGADLQSEHERFLVEKHFKSPVILFNYPASIKAFYMRANNDGKTVRAMDVLFPGIGEIIGGSQREERYDQLLDKMNELKIDSQELWWYLELRQFGTAEHSGFGLGFERLVQFVTGMSNIRDVIPFPRTPLSAEF